MLSQDLVFIFHGFILFLVYGSVGSQRRGLGGGGSQVIDFDCPEEFGYYPHPSDCTQYYVCVFGGALLESCIGGLMYSHELQTCDWPRNVGCEAAGGGDGGTISTVRVTDPRTRAPQQIRTSSSPQQVVQQQLQPSRNSQRHRQPEVIQQQLYTEEDLGPAEEIESDRQQRVYRGQPSTIGQVQRDRDGYRLSGVKNSGVTSQNVIPSGPGSQEKISVVSFGSQRASQPSPQDHYSNTSIDDLTTFNDLPEIDDNYLGGQTTRTRLRRKRQTHIRLGTLGYQQTHNPFVSTVPVKTGKIPIILIPSPKSSEQNSSGIPFGSGGLNALKIPFRPSSTSFNSQNENVFRIVHDEQAFSSQQTRYHQVKPSTVPSRYQFPQPANPHVQSAGAFAKPNPYQHSFPQNTATLFQRPQHVSTFTHSEFLPSKPLFSRNTTDENLFKLTKSTIQSAFRPVVPVIENYNPNLHKFSKPNIVTDRPKYIETIINAVAPLKPAAESPRVPPLHLQPSHETARPLFTKETSRPLYTAQYSKLPNTGQIKLANQFLKTQHTHRFSPPDTTTTETYYDDYTYLTTTQRPVQGSRQPIRISNIAHDPVYTTPEYNDSIEDDYTTEQVSKTKANTNRYRESTKVTTALPITPRPILKGTTALPITPRPIVTQATFYNNFYTETVTEKPTTKDNLYRYVHRPQQQQYLNQDKNRHDDDITEKQKGKIKIQNTVQNHNFEKRPQDSRLSNHNTGLGGLGGYEGNGTRTKIYNLLPNKYATIEDYDTKTTKPYSYDDYDVTTKITDWRTNNYEAGSENYDTSIKDYDTRTKRPSAKQDSYETKGTDGDRRTKRPNSGIKSSSYNMDITNFDTRTSRPDTKHIVDVEIVNYETKTKRPSVNSNSYDGENTEYDTKSKRPISYNTDYSDETKTKRPDVNSNSFNSDYDTRTKRPYLKANSYDVANADYDKGAKRANAKPAGYDAGTKSSSKDFGVGTWKSHPKPNSLPRDDDVKPPKEQLGKTNSSFFDYVGELGLVDRPEQVQGVHKNDQRFYVPDNTVNVVETTTTTTERSRRPGTGRWKPSSTTTTTSTTTSPPFTRKGIPEEYYENFKPFPTRPEYDDATSTTLMNGHFDDSSTKRHRVEPVDQYQVTSALPPVHHQQHRFNSSQRYQTNQANQPNQPSQYDQYYSLYDEDADLYRVADYGQQQSSQGSSTPSSIAHQYRGQSTYKDSGNSYNQDVYSPAPVVHDYNDQLNVQVDDQQYQQLQPSKSSSRSNATKDALPQPSISTSRVANNSVATSPLASRRAELDLDPSSVLVPPPPSPKPPRDLDTLLKPPQAKGSYYLEQFPQFRSNFPTVPNRKVLDPPRNGGALAKSLSNFDTILSSFFTAVTGNKQQRPEQQSLPETIVRSEIGRIPHDPIVISSPVDKTTTEAPASSTPDDYLAYFVEIEPKKPKTEEPVRGFLITKPDEVTEEPRVITRENLGSGQSDEVSFSLGGRGKSRQGSFVRVKPDNTKHIKLSTTLDIEPIAKPAGEDEDPKGLSEDSQNETIEEEDSRESLPLPLSGGPGLTRQKEVRFEDHFDAALHDRTRSRPHGFRTGENTSKEELVRSRFRTEEAAAEDEQPRVRGRVEDISSKENLSRSRFRAEDNASKVQHSRGRTRGGQVQDSEQPKLIDPPNPYRFVVVNLDETTTRQLSTPTPFIRNPDNEERNHDSHTRGRAQSEEENRNRFIPAVPETPAPVSVQPIRVQDSGVFLDEEVPRRRKPEVVEEEVTSTTTTTRRPVRIRTTTERSDVDERKTTRRVVKLHRSDLRNQRLTTPKVKRIRKPSTLAPLTEDLEEKTFTKENELHSTFRPIVVSDEGSLDATSRNRTRFRFTVENTDDYTLLPNGKHGLFASTTEKAEEPRGFERANVRPAYQPINPAIADINDGLEDTPFPNSPHLNQSHFPTHPTEDNRATTIHSRGKSKLSPQTTESPKARFRPTAATAEIQAPSGSPVSPGSHLPTRTRGGSSYNFGNTGNEVTVNRGTPATSRGTRPTLKPSTAIVSKASEFIDIYRFPPRRPENLYATPTPDKGAAKCRKDVCLLPDCSCGGKEIPAGYNAEEIPQLVLLTFDDSVNDLNKGLYSDLFERGRVNPNGCPISATFYVSHEWTDYSQVQNLYANGHEIASHSVSVVIAVTKYGSPKGLWASFKIDAYLHISTAGLLVTRPKVVTKSFDIHSLVIVVVSHNAGVMRHSFGEQFSQKKWTREVAGQREILSAYGGVRQEDIRGMRAPFLAVGGNKMFKMLYDANFTYDSSMPIYENRPPSWPYTLDYKVFHECMIPPCPTKSYPGVWEVPMVMWQDLNGGRCSMGDACSNPPTADGVYKMLIKNFERHFTTNRAPFGLFYHAAWFTQEHHKEGFIAFLDTIVNMPEVWLVTNWQAIQWVRDPQPLSTVNNFPPFQCNEEKQKKCNNPKVCNLWHKSGVRYMRTCQPCPEIYPWTGKTGVRNSRVDNEIIDE